VILASVVLSQYTRITDDDVDRQTTYHDNSLTLPCKLQRSAKMRPSKKLENYSTKWHVFMTNGVCEAVDADHC